MDINIEAGIGKVGDILTDTQKKKGMLIHAFQKIQQEYNYLPEEVINALSERLGIPLSEVYSTASFYKHFYLTPRGKKVVRVCTGTACHVRGAGKVLDAIKDEFGIDDGETTGDLSLTLETVGCVGCCGLAPVAVVNEEVIGEVDMKKIDAIIRAVKEG